MLVTEYKCTHCYGYRIPNYFWFVVSGTLCDVVQALIDYFVAYLYVYSWEKPTVCWTVSYSASVFVRHYSHRMLVFGDYDGTYCQSLTRTYMTYSSSIVLSILTNHLIVNFLYFTHVQAWIFTMLWTGMSISVCAYTATYT